MKALQAPMAALFLQTLHPQQLITVTQPGIHFHFFLLSLI